MNLKLETTMLADDPAAAYKMSIDDQQNGAAFVDISSAHERDGPLSGCHGIPRSRNEVANASKVRVDDDDSHISPAGKFRSKLEWGTPPIGSNNRRQLDLKDGATIKRICDELPGRMLSVNGNPGLSREDPGVGDENLADAGSRPQGTMCYRIVSIGLAAAFLGACVANGSDKNMPVAAATVCEDPRPQVCTMDYRPVCGTLVDGYTKTYANGCGACADVEVVSWVEGACSE